MLIYYRQSLLWKTKWVSRKAICQVGEDHNKGVTTWYTDHSSKSLGKPFTQNIIKIKQQFWNTQKIMKTNKYIKIQIMAQHHPWEKCTPNDIKLANTHIRMAVINIRKIPSPDDTQANGNSDRPLWGCKLLGLFCFWFFLKEIYFMLHVWISVRG